MRYYLGDIVEYSDMANPPRQYEVTAVLTSRYGTREYGLTSNGQSTFSDCRQAGWRLIDFRRW